ncbi:MAG: RDD family protein [Salinibacter sp.]
MPKRVAITTPEQVELEYELAGLGSRLMAFALDGLIVSGILVSLYAALLILGLGHPEAVGGFTSWVLALLVLVIFAVQWGYFIYFEVAHNGRTPGKRRLGLRVIRDSGQPIDVRGALIRNIVRLADLLFGIGLVVMFVSSQWRRLGDYAAGSFVIKDQPTEQSTLDAWHRGPANMGAGPYETLSDEDLSRVSRLTRRDYEAIAYLLQRSSSMSASSHWIGKLADEISSRMGLSLRAAEGQRLRFLREVADAYERIHGER